MNNTILLIENKPGVQNDISALMSSTGYQVYNAVTGPEGLDMARKFNPDLIVCNTQLPGLSGHGVLRAIENFPHITGTPFIFISDSTDNSGFREAMELGADDYLTLPIQGDELLRAIKVRLIKSETLKQKTYLPCPDDKIFLNTDLNIKKVHKRDFIFNEGDSSYFLYYIRSGKVKEIKTNDDGKDYITAIYDTGDYFGYRSLLCNCTRKESAVALEDSEIAMIPKQEFLKLLSTNKEAAFKFMQLMSAYLTEASDTMLRLAYDSARKRIAEALLHITKKYKNEDKEDSVFSINRENISALAGTSIESVSRNLTTFKEEGLIETIHGNIRILNYDKLHGLRG